ncbi:hypothetical protein MS2017_2137 [Bathymodiolus thermophilus thioautotrophic gill symbiont]|uniref:DUF4136 domain-containing protein n=1 Tax=Bathymodiolus thermophilus thioautotrophic gill symbiont TaxID=2360 RepID=A0A3G3IQ19_9GAMM|nr:hypothetical protein [Bathymodiolus thermophilus thioautotrophic gill symbiont]AYQ57789.1 hypothetical protein MS2017_2137 [Bathymodiolus thermophilus thioautotrophic gill symbiont]
MKKHFISIFVLILLLTGCSTTPLTKQQLSKVQTVAIVNSFPKHPSYSLIGTTVFQNEISYIGGEDYRAELSNMFVKYFTQKGYKNIAVYNNKKEAKGDLIIMLEPAELNVPGVYGNVGYGIYQKSFFGISGDPLTYIEMNASAELRSGEEFNTHFHNSIPTSFKKLTKKWNDLSDSKKDAIRGKIKKSMKKSVKSAMHDLGL